MTTARELHEALSATTFRFVTEADLQGAIEKYLTTKGISFEREVRLGPKERIDFLVGTIGVEIKVDGATNEVARQLVRYLDHERISEVVLVTSRARHRQLPASFGGKPVHVVHLLNSVF